MLEKVSKSQIQWRGIEKMDELRKRKKDKVGSDNRSGRNSTLEAQQKQISELQSKALDLDLQIKKLQEFRQDNAARLHCTVSDIASAIDMNNSSNVNQDENGRKSNIKKMNPDKFRLVIGAPVGSTIEIPYIYTQSGMEKPTKLRITNQSAHVANIESKSRKRKISAPIIPTSENDNLDPAHKKLTGNRLDKEPMAIDPIQLIWMKSSFDTEKKSYQLKTRHLTPLNAAVDKVMRGLDMSGGSGDYFSSDHFAVVEEEQNVSDFF